MLNHDNHKPEVEALKGEYLNKGQEWVDNELKDVVKAINSYTSSVPKGENVGKTEDGPFKNLKPAEKLEKFMDLSLQAKALREVHNHNREVERQKEAAARRIANGDGDSPVINPQDADVKSLVSTLGGIKPLNHKIRDIFAKGVEDGTIDLQKIKNQNVGEVRWQLGSTSKEQMDIINQFKHGTGADTGDEEYQSFRQTLQRHTVMMPLTRFDLYGMLPTGQVSQDVVRYNEQIREDDNTGVRAEGAKAALSKFNFTRRTADLVIISSAYKIVEEVLDDHMYLETILTTRLSDLWKKNVGARLINGAATNDLRGFASYTTTAQFGATLEADGGQPAAATVAGNIPVWVSGDASSDSGLQNSAQTSIAGVNHAAMFVYEETGDHPDMICIKPQAWAAIRTARDNENNFLFAPGGFMDSTFPLMGMGVVLENNIADGRILLGNFRGQSQLFYRGGMEQAIGYSGEGFEEYVRTVRMGARMQLVIYIKDCFVWVTNTISSQV